MDPNKETITKGKVETQDGHIFYHTVKSVHFDVFTGLLYLENIPSLGDNFKEEVCYPTTNLVRFTVTFPVEEKN